MIEQNELQIQKIQPRINYKSKTFRKFYFSGYLKFSIFSNLKSISKIRNFRMGGPIQGTCVSNFSQIGSAQLSKVSTEERKKEEEEERRRKHF